MIHNLKSKIVTPLGENSYLVLTFTFICETGHASVKIIIGKDHDKDNRPKAFVTDYLVLGVPYTDEHSNDSVMNNGIKKIGNQISDLCNCNGWALWSY